METLLRIFGFVFGAVSAFYMYRTVDALLGLKEIEREFVFDFSVQYFLRYLLLALLFGGMAIFLLTR